MNNNIPNMIQNGSFGYNQPMNTGGYYNPYMQPQMYQQPNYNPQYGNMIPIGSYNYNNTAFAQQQQQNNFVFRPVTPYNPSPMNQVQNYYNPFGQSNPYQQYYFNYRPFMSMQKKQEIMNGQISVSKLKLKIQLTMCGVEYTDDMLDKACNPENPANKKTQKEIDDDREWQMVQRMHYYSLNPPNIDYPERNMAWFIQLRSQKFHEAYDNHSMYQFFEEDYPKLKREVWIAENIKKNATRDLSGVYSSNDYNELLNMHRSSNPYINDLLNISKYDNNIDDMEVGIKQVFEAERRRIQRLTEGVPQIISSKEVQEKRRLFTDELMQLVYQKGANKGSESS